MEPFVAENDQRIVHEKPIVGRGDGGKSSSLILIILVVALLGMGGAMVAVVYSQKQSFDALQQNFQTLQGKLPASAAPAEDMEAVAEEEAEEESAPVVAPATTSTDSPEIAQLTAALSRLEQTIGNLDSRIDALDSKVANLPRSSGGGNNQALTQTTSRLSSEVATLRKEILEMKLSLNDAESNSKAVQADIAHRLNSTETAIMSLNNFRREASSGQGGIDSVVIDKIQRDIRLLRKQHPYLKENS